MSSGDEKQQGGGQAEPQNGVPAAVPPSFGASTAPQPAAATPAAAAAPALAPPATPVPPPPPAPLPPPPPASAIPPIPPGPTIPTGPIQLGSFAGSSVAGLDAGPKPEPEPTVGWYASAGPYAAVAGNVRPGTGGRVGKTSATGAIGARSRPTWGSNRSKLVNATLFGVAPLALAGIVAAAFMLASPGKGQASSHAGFQAAAGPSAAQQQAQGNGSTSTTQPSQSKSSTRPGKRSTMPDGKPRPSQSASNGNANGSGHNPGSKPKSQPAKKKKPSSSSGGPVIPANLGIPNFDGYCGHIGRGSAVTTVNTAYGWACSVNPSLPMSIQDACSYTYGLPLSKIINVSTNYHDPNAWQCWRTNGIVGQLNIVSYCTAAGLGAAKLSPADAYGWTCGGQPIDTNAACQLMYHNGNAFSRFAVFQDPYSWQCWA